MNAIQTHATEAAADTVLVTDEGRDAIFARSEGATVVPFSRSLTPVATRGYASLAGVKAGAPVHEERAHETLGRHELLSIEAVLSHIAHSQDVKQEILQAVVEAEFSVPSIAKIPLTQFHNVMEFLIDLRMDSVRSRR